MLYVCAVLVLDPTSFSFESTFVEAGTEHCAMNLSLFPSFFLSNFFFHFSLFHIHDT
jgi:hypothetical protein